ncbi:hypothetical protein MUP79_08955 [Candidatus Bathyarchaeota archaeon]|nr:hypothetical protein [Candidatus Bathyarchaeota archaeon]
MSSFAYRVISAITGLVNPLTGATLPLGFVNVILARIIFMMVIGALIFWVIIAGIANLVARYIFRDQGSRAQIESPVHSALLQHGIDCSKEMFFDASIESRGRARAIR